MLCAVPGSSFAQGRPADHHMPSMANRVASPPAVARPRAAHVIGRYSTYAIMPIILSHQTRQTLLCKAMCGAPLPLHRRSNWHARSFLSNQGTVRHLSVNIHSIRGIAILWSRTVYMLRPDQGPHQRNMLS